MKLPIQSMFSLFSAEVTNLHRSNIYIRLLRKKTVHLLNHIFLKQIIGIQKSHNGVLLFLALLHSIISCRRHATVIFKMFHHNIIGIFLFIFTKNLQRIICAAVIHQKQTDMFLKSDCLMYYTFYCFSDVIRRIVSGNNNPKHNVLSSFFLLMHLICQ